MRKFTESDLKKAGITIRWREKGWREKSELWQVVDGRKVVSAWVSYVEALEAANALVQAEV